MKRIKKQLSARNPSVKIVGLIIFFFLTCKIFAQQTLPLIKGLVLDSDSLPVPSTTIVLTKLSQTASQPFWGTISNENGIFEFSQVERGKYMLRISSVGYASITKEIDVVSFNTIDAGIFILQDSTFLLGEAVVVAERTKDKSEGEKSIYFMNSKIVGASGNVPDLLRHIPGVQVDLKQNISLNGSSNILIFVEGKERDKSYISQLNPAQIDKVEVLTTPPSNYEGDVSGVINIILKKDRNTGFSGHVFSEIPTSSAIVYSFPTYSLHYNYKKFNLYTSYNGEINYEDIDESTKQQIKNSNLTVSFIQQVRQKNLSHKFHYGVDYYATPHDIFSFYGFLNPYLSEQNGDVTLQTSGNTSWNVQRQETDKNRNLFNSLYYKHQFNDNGSELSAEYDHVHIYSNNELIYYSTDDSIAYNNKENPQETDHHLKIDFTATSNKKIKLNTGINIKRQSMQDRQSGGFHYRQQIYAWYGSASWQSSKCDVNFGLRLEDAESKCEGNFNKSDFAVLPYAAFHYKINDKQSLSLSYRRRINRPSIYALNPYTYTDNPYNIRKGNPLLSSEYWNTVSLEYALRFRSNYISTRFFYESGTDVINNLTILNDSSIFETQSCNLGSIHNCGLQVLGSLSFGILTITPSIRVYNRTTTANDYARQNGVENRTQWVFESGLTSILSFKHDFALSTIFQYATKKNNIQDNYYCDALYFVSLDKTCKKNLRIGIVAALPFAKTFVYQGSDIDAPNFASRYTGNLKLPTVPLMFRFTYQFNFGKNRANLARKAEDVVTRPKSGF